MKKCKFKVGDIVRATADRIYTVTCRSNEWVGKVKKVEGRWFSAKTIQTENDLFKDVTFPYLDYRFFEKVDTAPVTITKHLIRGNKTIIKLSNGKVGIAKCDPADKFDAVVGATIATLRAYGKNTEDFAKEFTTCEHNGKTEKEEPSTVGQIDQIKDSDRLLIELLFLSLGQQPDLKHLKSCKKSSQSIDKKEN